MGGCDVKYFLGIDVGGSKSHALVADERGRALGFGAGGPGCWESVGYPELTRVLKEITAKALAMAGLGVERLDGAGMGLCGFDWPSQLAAHREAVQPIGLACPVAIVNDATLGIWAGSSEGWGLSVVAGSGCNCRGLSRDHRREGRIVGGAGHWSQENVGGLGLTFKAVEAVSFEWTRRGPATALTPALIDKFGAKDLDDLMEGIYVGRYPIVSDDVRLVFRIAHAGDPAAVNVLRWSGEQLGSMACGVIRQLNLEREPFEVVLIGSLYNGHPLMTECMAQTIHGTAPGARLVRLNAPPVAGGVLLGMHEAGFQPAAGVRHTLIENAREIRKAG